MKYKNANEVLPPDLLEQVKKYAAGKLLYIPTNEDSLNKEKFSESRRKLQKRNQRIYDEFVMGKSIGELADEHYLSVDSIKKIVYGRKNEFIQFDNSIDSALLYTKAGLAEEWMYSYILRNNEELNFDINNWICDGLVRVPLRLIDSVVESDYVESEKEPFIIVYQRGKLTLYGEKKFFNKLIEKKINSYPAFVLVFDKEEYSLYAHNYGKYFHQAIL